MIFDAHNDLLTAEIPDSGKGGILRGYEKSGALCGVTLAVWTTGGIKSARDIFALTEPIRALKTGFKVLFAVEDVGFASENDVEELAGGNFCYISLTWNNDNKFAGGAYGAGGLTAAGKRAVKKLSQSAYIDCAHLNEKSFYGATEITDKIIVSHTAFSGVREHPRNISDEQIKVVLERGGGCGLAFVGEFLSEKKAGISDAIKHIDYFVQKFGDEGLFIGTDFFGTRDLPCGLEYYDSFAALKYGLEALGYGNSSVKNIFYGNYSRIMKVFV